MHIWSRDAAITARYIQDKVSPDLATEFRREVFASQYQISSKEDLQHFTQKFFTENHKQVPFVIDPTGQFAKEVNTEEALGRRLVWAIRPPSLSSRQSTGRKCSMYRNSTRRSIRLRLNPQTPRLFITPWLRTRSRFISRKGRAPHLCDGFIVAG